MTGCNLDQHEVAGFDAVGNVSQYISGLFWIDRGLVYGCTHFMQLSGVVSVKSHCLPHEQQIVSLVRTCRCFTVWLRAQAILGRDIARS